MKAFCFIVACSLIRHLPCYGTYATFPVSRRPHHSRFVRQYIIIAIPPDMHKSVSGSTVPPASSPASDTTVRRLKECCASLHSCCSKWRKLNSAAVDHAAAMANASIRLRSQ